MVDNVVFGTAVVSGMVARGRLVVGGVSGSSYWGSARVAGASVAGGAGAGAFCGGVVATVALERGGDVVALGAGDVERVVATGAPVFSGGTTVVGAWPGTEVGSGAGRALATVVVVLEGREDAGTDDTGRVPAVAT